MLPLVIITTVLAVLNSIAWHDQPAPRPDRDQQQLRK